MAGLCFDITSSNTGIHQGAITVIQQAFDKRLLFLACRHHVLEVVASAVFDHFFSSTGPNIALFARFKEYWNNLNLENFAPLKMPDQACVSELSDSENKWLSENAEEVTQFLLDLLKSEAQPRHNYLEFIHLSLILLNKSECKSSDDDVKFCPPGAYHRARWMAKGIYSLKIYSFRQQLKLTQREQQALQQILHIYCHTLY